jgi:hypothetical protein
MTACQFTKLLAWNRHLHPARNRALELLGFMYKNRRVLHLLIYLYKGTQDPHRAKNPSIFGNYLFAFVYLRLFAVAQHALVHDAGCSVTAVVMLSQDDYEKTTYIYQLTKGLLA